MKKYLLSNLNLSIKRNILIVHFIIRNSIGWFPVYTVNPKG